MTSKQLHRRLGKSGLDVGPMGIGTWAIGGPFWSGEGCHYPTGTPLGYGKTDDRESIRAIHCAVDLGAKLFDTADAYGVGHGERILGEALKGCRDRVLIATKFGNTYDSRRKELTGTNVSAGYIRQACLASLRRLQTDWIDLYQLHVGDIPEDTAIEVSNTLEQLCQEGLIRHFAWSTDDPRNAAIFGNCPNAVAVQFDMNVLQDSPDMLTVCESFDYGGLVRSPLAMGFLSGKHTTNRRLPTDDIRSRPPEWLKYFKDGGSADPVWLARLEVIREILTSSGRTLPQGALAWIWARSTRAIPIPGIRTEAQAKENLGAIEFGPLLQDEMDEIERLLERG